MFSLWVEGEQIGFSAFNLIELMNGPLLEQRLIGFSLGGYVLKKD